MYKYSINYDFLHNNIKNELINYKYHIIKSMLPIIIQFLLIYNDNKLLIFDEIEKKYLYKYI